MDQLELLSIENPCIGVCKSDNRGYCEGCFRSRNERFDWSKLDSQQKRKVLELCKGRAKRRKAKLRKQQIITSTTVESTNAALAEPTSPAKDQATAAQTTQNQAKPTEPAQQTIKDMGLDLFDL